MDLNNEIKVSVYCACYNQKDFIRKTLDSILSQKTDFKFEIIVRDDNSTDGTREIVEEYQEKFPEIVKPVFEVENRFQKREAMEAFLDAASKMRGYYLAICEGDDYWESKDKLQKQIDFLDKNPEFSGCFHKVARKNIITNEIEYYLPSDTQIANSKKDRVFDAKETIEHYCMGIVSCVFRLEPYKKELLELGVKNIINWDTYLIYYFAIKSKLKYIDNLLAVSQMGVNNLWNNKVKSEDTRNVKYWFEIINFPIEVDKLLQRYNLDIYHEPKESALRRVLKSAINLKRYDIVEEIKEKFQTILNDAVFEPKIPDFSSERNYLNKKIKKYKKLTSLFVFLTFVFGIISLWLSFLIYIK